MDKNICIASACPLTAHTHLVYKDSAHKSSGYVADPIKHQARKTTQKVDEMSCFGCQHVHERGVGCVRRQDSEKCGVRKFRARKQLQPDNVAKAVYQAPLRLFRGAARSRNFPPWQRSTRSSVTAVARAGSGEPTVSAGATKSSDACGQLYHKHTLHTCSHTTQPKNDTFCKPKLFQ